MYDRQKDEMMQRYKNELMLQNLRNNQQKQNNRFQNYAKTLYNGYKLINGVNKAKDLADKYGFFGHKTPGANFVNKIGGNNFMNNLQTGQNPSQMFSNPMNNGMSNLGNTSLNTAQLPTNTIGSAANGVGGAANAAGAAGNAANAANAASTASNAASAAQGASSAAQGASSAAGAASSAGSAVPVAGAALGALSAGSNFAKGDYVNGAMDAAKTGAAFIPGVGWIAAAAIQVAQMLRNAFMKKQQKAMQKGQEEANKAQQFAENNLSEQQQGFDEQRAQNMQNMQEQMQKTNGNDSIVQDVIGRYKAAEEAEGEDGSVGGTGNGNGNGEQGFFKSNMPFAEQFNGLMDKLPFDTTDFTTPVSNKVYGWMDNKLGTNLEDTLGEMSPEVAAFDSSPINRHNSKGEIVKPHNWMQDREGEKKIGRYGAGNIDLYNRPQVKNDDGSISTVRSMSFNDGDNEVLIPTVSDDGKILSDGEAIDNYYKTGNYLGKFDTIDDANEYAQRLHNEQDRYYNQDKPTMMDKIFHGGMSKATRDWAHEAEARDGYKFDRFGRLISSPDITGGAAGVQPKGYMGDLPDLDKAGQALKEQEEVPQEGTPEANKRSIMNRLNGFFNDFAQGYEDNSTHGWKEGDLYKQAQMTNRQPQLEEGDSTGIAAPIQQPKGFGNRFGEFVGTGQRVMANPWTQAALAGAITKATGGNWADVANNAYKYGTNKATSDYYQKQINPNAKPSVLGNYDYRDYNAQTLNNYRTTMSDMNKAKVKAQLDQNMPLASDYYDSLLASNQISLDDYNRITTDPSYNPNQRISLNSIKTTTDSKYKQDTIKAKNRQIDNNYQLGKERNQIGWTNASTNRDRLTETKRHNGVTESQGQAKIDDKNAKDKAKADAQRQKELDYAIQTGEKVRMIAPDGSTAIVDKNKVKEYLKKGARVVR